MRSRIYSFILAFFFVLLLIGLFFVQIYRGGYYHTLSLKNTIRLIPQNAYRGKIHDRNGVPMADNILSFDAVIIPQELKDQEASFAKIAALLKTSVKDLRRRYKRNYLNPFTPVVVAEGVSKTEAIILDEQKNEIPGLAVELNSRRFYPYGTAGAHVLGYLGEIDADQIKIMKEYGYSLKDKMGQSGVEAIFDMSLRGEKGGQQIEVDSQGRQVRLLGYRPSRQGRDIQLTIDAELTRMADQLLAGKKGAFVLMDARNGEVLVMVSSPSFDPNVFADRFARKEELSQTLLSPYAPLFNRAIKGQFPPGSIFKIVTAASAAKVKRLKPAKTYLCKGGMQVGNRIFKCWDTHGEQDFLEAMGHSCDIYFYQLGIAAGPDMMFQMSYEFGLGEETGIDLANEAKGMIPNKAWKRSKKHEGWYDGDTVNFSIGQGFVLTTPLQLARMMAAVANGGLVLTPLVTKSVDGKDVPVHQPRQIKIDAKDLELIKMSLRYPVAMGSGTAHELDIAGLDICAKTGTAQVTGSESHGWVAGFFPAAQPRYAFCILIENAGSSHYACALGRQFFDQALSQNKL